MSQCDSRDTRNDSHIAPKMFSEEECEILIAWNSESTSLLEQLVLWKAARLNFLGTGEARTTVGGNESDAVSTCTSFIFITAMDNL